MRRPGQGDEALGSVLICPKQRGLEPSHLAAFGTSLGSRSTPGRQTVHVPQPQAFLIRAPVFSEIHSKIQVLWPQVTSTRRMGGLHTYPKPTCLPSDSWDTPPCFPRRSHHHFADPSQRCAHGVPGVRLAGLPGSGSGPCPSCSRCQATRFGSTVLSHHPSPPSGWWFQPGPPSSAVPPGGNERQSTVLLPAPRSPHSTARRKPRGLPVDRSSHRVGD